MKRLVIRLFARTICSLYSRIESTYRALAKLSFYFVFKYAFYVKAAFFHHAFYTSILELKISLHTENIIKDDER